MPAYIQPSTVSSGFGTNLASALGQAMPALAAAWQEHHGSGAPEQQQQQVQNPQMQVPDLGSFSNVMGGQQMQQPFQAFSTDFRPSTVGPQSPFAGGSPLAPQWQRFDPMFTVNAPTLR